MRFGILYGGAHSGKTLQCSMEGKRRMAEVADGGISQAMPTPRSSGRLDSLDLARGISILLVIFVHSYGHNYADIAGHGTISKIWDVMVSATKPIRMPTFFLISGYLAKSLVKQDWRVLFEKRVLFLLYMYTIWLFINQMVASTLQFIEAGHAIVMTEVIGSVLFKLVAPYSFLWFLWALSLYNIVARATMRLPLWAVLGVAAIISGLSEQLVDQPSYIMRCGFFFLLGARCPELINQVTARANWRIAAGMVAAYIAAVGLIFLLGEKFPGVWLPAGLVGSATIIMIGTLISHWSLVSVIKYLGRNTLQLYVLHPMLISLLTFVEMRYLPGMIAGIRSTAPVLAIYPILFVATVTALAIAIWAILTRAGLGFLFEKPWGKAAKPAPQAVPAT